MASSTLPASNVNNLLYERSRKEPYNIKMRGA
jgi:hypothetical protein